MFRFRSRKNGALLQRNRATSVFVFALVFEEEKNDPGISTNRPETYRFQEGIETTLYFKGIVLLCWCKQEEESDPLFERVVQKTYEVGTFQGVVRHVQVRFFSCCRPKLASFFTFKSVIRPFWSHKWPILWAKMFHLSGKLRLKWPTLTTKGFLTAHLSGLMVFCGPHLPLAFQFVCGPGGGGAEMGRGACGLFCLCCEDDPHPHLN